MTNTFNSVQDHEAVNTYTVQNVSFTSYMKSAFEKIYLKDDFLIQRINPRHYDNDIENMIQMGLTETPYFMQEETNRTISRYVTYGLFKTKPVIAASTEPTSVPQAEKPMIGIAQCYIEEKEPDRAVMGGIYIYPQYRGNYKSMVFYQARLDWALEQKEITKLSTYICEHNQKAIRAAQNFGLIHKPADTMLKRWGENGELTANELHFEFDMKRYRNMNFERH